MNQAKTQIAIISSTVLGALLGFYTSTWTPEAIVTTIYFILLPILYLEARYAFFGDRCLQLSVGALLGALLGALSGSALDIIMGALAGTGLASLVKPILEKYLS